MRGRTVSHAPTEAKPKNSKQASVITPVVSSTMPDASSTTHAIEDARNRRRNPGMPRLDATSASSESPSPAAARS
jgi:hypothetical protein